MAPTSNELWKLLHNVSDRLTHLEPVVQSLKEQSDKTETRLADFEREVRDRFQEHRDGMHELTSDMNSQIHDLRSEQKVQMTRIGFYIGILTFLGMTIGGWIIKTGLDSVRASIVQNHNAKP